MPMDMLRQRKRMFLKGPVTRMVAGSRSPTAMRNFGGNGVIILNALGKSAPGHVDFPNDPDAQRLAETVPMTVPRNLGGPVGQVS